MTLLIDLKNSGLTEVLVLTANCENLIDFDIPEEELLRDVARVAGQFGLPAPSTLS